MFPALAAAQSQPEWKQVMERLSRLEEQNRELMTELRSLRKQLTPPTGEVVADDGGAATTKAEIGERLAIQETRVAELQQTKVESERRLPLKLTGTLLFNAYLNGRSGAGQNPVLASTGSTSAVGGASFRQTVLGLKFTGPTVLGGAKVTGSVFMDFFGGSGGPLNQQMRLRVATVDFAWSHTTFSVGQDKPIIAPREPDSLAQVGISPLTDAGNLWLWQPQARVEQRFEFGSTTGLRAQVGVYQTSESGTGLAAEYGDRLTAARPGLEGRFEFWKQFGESRRIELAPGFHVSDTHVAGVTAPSRIYSIDWLIRPVSWFDLTGMFFEGENVSGLGSLRQSVTSFPDDTFRSVRAYGGWAQASFRANRRLTFNLYGGQQDDRNQDLLKGGIGKNQMYAINAIYRLGSNVLTSIEASQVRTTYLGLGTRLNPHYDLAIAYLF
ncbi:MAG: hypothetical protein ABI823_04550 [Bryobacteraceae bacterium]